MQINLAVAPTVHGIYQEKVSGVGRARPEFQKMMQQIRKDDVLVIGDWTDWHDRRECFSTP